MPDFDCRRIVESWPSQVTVNGALDIIDELSVISRLGRNASKPDTAVATPEKSRATMRLVFLWATVVSFGLGCLAAPATTQDKVPDDDLLVQDHKLVQGKWELLLSNEGKGAPTLRSVKEIEGSRETLRRYDAKSGKLMREHAVEFILSRSGDVRVFTFYSVGGDPKQGQSFVYKVDGENFYDIPGLLHGVTYRNYQESPTV